MGNRKARKPVTVRSLIPFCQRTGQMHLLAGLPEGAEIRPNRPNSCVSAPERVNTAENGSEGCNRGKKRLEMNGTEREFAMLLENWRQQGKIALWEYEAITLRWGVLSVLKYTPDFLVIDQVQLTPDMPGVPIIQCRLIEVKADFIRNRQAAVRTFKDAREKWHHLFKFEFWQKTKENGWTQTI